MIDEKKLIEEIKKHFDAIYREDGELLSSDHICISEDVDDLIKLVDNQPQADKWIPCSERLPENLEQVIVWYEYFRYGDYNCMYQTYGIGYHLDGFWSGDVSGHQARCIAWQPLPQPYKKKEGNSNENT